MMAKRRVPMQVSPDFVREMKKLKLKIMANGVETSLRDLTEELAKSPMLQDIEKRVLRKGDINLNFDGRKR